MNKAKKKMLVPKLRFPEFREAGEWAIEPMGELYAFKGTNSFYRDMLNYENGSVKNIHYGDIHTKFSTLFDIEKEVVPFVNPQVSLEKIKSENYCTDGDMVFADASEDIDDVGKSIEIINLNNEKVLSGLHTLLARQKNSKLIVGFGGYLFKSNGIREQIKKESQGAKVLGISATRLSNISVYFPTNKKEQQKIAGCLASIDALITAHSQKLESLKAHKKGLMQQLFPNDELPMMNGECSRTKPIHHSSFTTHNSLVPRLRFSKNEDWTVASLPEFVFFQEGPGIMAVDFRSEGVPLVRLAGVGGAVVTLDGCNYLDPEKVEQKWAHFRLELNDIIISTSATFGLSSIVTEATAGAVFYTGLIRFRPSNERVDRGYLKAFLGSPHFARQAESAAVGGGIKHFGPTHLKQMEIPIPPLPEQQKIADCLASIDALITAQVEKVEALKAHKKGLMQQLFPQEAGA